MIILDHKIGDTFFYNGQREGGLTGINVQSQVRTRAKHNEPSVVVADLQVGITNTEQGYFNMMAPLTIDWPNDWLIWDIQYSHDGLIFSTETVAINAQKDNTK